MFALMLASMFCQVFKPKATTGVKEVNYKILRWGAMSCYSHMSIVDANPSLMVELVDDPYENTCPAQPHIHSVTRMTQIKITECHRCCDVCEELYGEERDAVDARYTFSLSMIEDEDREDDVGEETVKTTSLGAAHQLLGQKGCGGDDEKEAHSTQR
ncbi:hypothetical protein Fmac_008375 [Flemingia macrophylla]|uniref:Uncharacterized protein n=1 Tax=Flemingia macrophylla TaxID=520843 RepID=A0ABD1MX91_9FABA